MDLKQAELEPMVEILVFSNEMAPGNNGTNTPIDAMKKNYKNLDEITADVKNHGIDEYLKHDTHGRFGFYLCEGCAGPMLGHIQTKCQHGERYDDRMIKSFENWLERIPEFKKQVGERMKNMEDRQAETQAKKLREAVKEITNTNLQAVKEISNPLKEILERVGLREPNPPNPATTQLIKARLPPVWVGQKFDKWKLEVKNGKRIINPQMKRNL